MDGMLGARKIDGLFLGGCTATLPAVESVGENRCPSPHMSSVPFEITALVARLSGGAPGAVGTMPSVCERVGGGMPPCLVLSMTPVS